MLPNLFFNCGVRPASPAPKANDDLARAAFYTDYAKVKNGLALGVRVNAVVIFRLYSLILLSSILTRFIELGHSHI